LKTPTRLRVLLVTLLLCRGGVLYSDPPPAISLPLTGKIIVLDPGHAVKDESGKIINPGARARRFGAWERDVALGVALKVVPLLEAQGAKVYLTRTGSNPWRYNRMKRSDNRSRAIFANVVRANAYVRLHCDWNRSHKLHGFTSYYFRWGSRTLAKTIQRSVGRTWPGRDDGIQRRSFVSASAKMPAVLLEMGYLSNPKEGKELATDTHQTALAQVIAQGIVDYFKK